MYTTISQVRELSGFDDSTNITDAVVRGKIIAATSEFNSAVSARYSLPLFYHKSNSLTFSGTGSGTGTMTIVINGVNYEIEITDGLTAAEAADLFRALESEDFAIDTFYGQALVTIVSKDCTTPNSDQVTITSAPTTEGISAAIGSITDYYPEIVSYTVAEMAAIKLLIDNYGIEAADTNRDGFLRKEQMNETLQKIQGVHESGQTINLYDEICETQLAASGSSVPSFYPTDASSDDPTNPTAPKFSVNSVY